MKILFQPGGNVNLATHAKVASLALDKLVQWACVLLLILLVLDVWLGIMARYVLPFSMTFTEELARYLMIWMALLAVSCGIVHREHIGVEFIFDRVPPKGRRVLAVSFDIIAFVFFATLFWYGLGFVDRGFRRITMIYDIPKAYPFMIVPIASAIACIQLLLTGFHDAVTKKAAPSVGATTLLNATDDLDESEKR